MDKLHWNAYRFFRQEVKREIRIAEQEYVRFELINSKDNTNSIWKVISRCVRKKSAQIATSEDPLAQANKYNEFYASVGKTIAEKVQTTTPSTTTARAMKIQANAAVTWSSTLDFFPLYTERY